MLSFKKPLLGIIFAATLSWPLALSAQDEPDPNRVLATVNGVEITLGHVIALRADLPPQYDQFPAALLFDGILEQLIQQTLLMQSFDDPLSRQSEILLENERRAVIAGEAIALLMEGDVDEDALQSAYDEQYPDNSDQLEYRASHILVDTEEDAIALIDALEGGADFAELAREKSTGPSGEAGGDLGWFGDGDMVPDFFAAVVALEPDGISPPVETQFGWHVIKLSETRPVERPAFDTVREELESQMREAQIETQINALEEQADLTRSDTADLDPEVINLFDLLEN